MRVLVTRPEPDLSRTMANIRAAGHEPIACPATEIRLAHGFLPAGGGWRGLILTSRHAVAALEAENAVGRLAALPVMCVGAATALAAEAAGFRQVENGGGSAETMIERIVALGWPGPLLYVSGADIATDPAQALARNSIMVGRVVGYAADACGSLPAEAVSALAGGAIDGIVFFSKRAVGIFAELAETGGVSDRLAEIVAVCISPAVAGTARERGFGRVVTAPEPTEAAMVDLLAEAL